MRTRRPAAGQPARGHSRAAIIRPSASVKPIELRAAIRFPAREYSRAGAAVAPATRDRLRSMPYRYRRRASETQCSAGLGRLERVSRAQAARSWPAATSAGRPRSRRAPPAALMCRAAGDAAIGKNRLHQRVHRRRAETAGEPMPGLPVRSVAPDLDRGGKQRIWPRIPGPQWIADGSIMRPP